MDRAFCTNRPHLGKTHQAALRALLFLVLGPLLGCETTGSIGNSGAYLDTRDFFQIVINKNIVLLPYNITEKHADWRIGFLIDSERIIVPASANIESFFVATIHRFGFWDAVIVQGFPLNNLVSAAFIGGTTGRQPAEEAVKLKVGNPIDYLDTEVAFASYNGTRTILRTGILNGFQEMISGELLLDIALREGQASEGDVGGPVFAANGELIGVITDGPFELEDEMSVIALSATDFMSLLESLPRNKEGSLQLFPIGA
jgi:hypothetical protein